jgi:hypothetical protein
MRYADTDTGVFPSYDVQSLLEDHHGLEYEHEFDLALRKSPPCAEFVFDAAKVPDADIVISTVQEIVDRFNQPPDELPEEKREAWNESEVVVSDVVRGSDDS